MCETAKVEVLPAPVTTDTYNSIKQSCDAAFSASSISDATSCAYQTAGASQATNSEKAGSSSVSADQVSALADDTQAQAAAMRLEVVRELASRATESTPYTTLLTMTDAGE